MRYLLLCVAILLAACSRQQNTLKCYVDHYDASTRTVTKNVEVPCPQ